MSGLISSDAIQDVRSRINLVELVSERTLLRKRGRNHVGLCPFHAENTPSFTVNEERGFFHCFGCGASGDVFAWIMRTEQVSFPDAVRQLAARLGVVLPSAPGARRDRGGDDLLFRANEEAAGFYQRALWGEGAGTVARSYLEKRGIDNESARRWGLGYAPGAGDVLVRWLRSRGLATEGALSVGLIGRRPDGTLFDRFRARLMFPITDGNGRIAGFGGRILPGAASDAPKYLNSSESAVFKKGHLVYGLPHARDAIRAADQAVVVEGYLDVLALHQHGLETAVAPLGTALTVDQLRYLRRYTDRIVACFDGDDAGTRAAARAFAIFVEAGLWGQAAFLPRGEDPDSFVRAHGAQALQRLLGEGRLLLDVFLQGLIAPGEPSVGRRVQAAREVGRLLRRVRNPWEYDVLARRAAERIGVGEELLRGEGSPAPPRPRESAARPGAHRVTGESLLIELMLTGRDAIERVMEAGGAALFEDADWSSLAQSIIDGAQAGADPTMLMDQLPGEMRSRVAAAILREPGVEADRAQLLEDCLVFIRRRVEKRRLREAVEAIRSAEAAGDEVRIREGLDHWRSLVEPTDAESSPPAERQE